MEQQPGPVNWAFHNPSPAPGMARLWALEAFAHGAELVSFFRWRQVPFGQEQFHSGLLLPDGDKDEAYYEIERLRDDLAKLKAFDLNQPGEAAIVISYESIEALSISRQNSCYIPLRWTIELYQCLKNRGIFCDIAHQDHNLSQYQLEKPEHFGADDTTLFSVKGSSDRIYIPDLKNSKILQ